jgi:hypothetical protein
MPEVESSAPLIASMADAEEFAIGPMLNERSPASPIAPEPIIISDSRCILALLLRSELNPWLLGKPYGSPRSVLCAVVAAAEDVLVRFSPSDEGEEGSDADDADDADGELVEEWKIERESDSTYNRFGSDASRSFPSG